MRKTLSLLLATFAVATTFGRETSAGSISPTNCEKEAFVMPWKKAASEDVAFVMPWKKAASEDLAFVMPWKKAASEDLAFVMPWKRAGVPICDTGLRIDSEKFAMLPLGAETGRHIRSSDEKSPAPDAARGQEPKPVAQVAEYSGTNYAMLPLGAETGRHIRGSDERSPAPGAARDQERKPVAQIAEYFGTSYAMLPLGAETGRHIRNLGEDNKQPEKTVATNASKTTA
jgi:hypothetical protein